MQRKVVTVLFCDVVGSTALGETTDPEALDHAPERYVRKGNVVMAERTRARIDSLRTPTQA